ncbi:hypothetical protein F3Y22_tig00110234pilonHSYRG00154 [Hibiscus syriacus]|uniref:laccase n=1 Tax=Hibiscus syriacus TaxID=106335 RepID=A0A6A3B9U2_HIBSY|nr:hypothetical protein F3Y22_tig00110234pilonHSYRG00154 [Hibiscus syriacus]
MRQFTSMNLLPTLEVQDGDTLVINAINKSRYNATLHWHGVRQLRNPWADGPELVTQCPIRPGQSYTYQFTIQNQEGTLWWHGHSRWLRATVMELSSYILNWVLHTLSLCPRKKFQFFLESNGCHKTGTFHWSCPNISDALTINGQPGDLYRCSSKETAVFPVDAGETILLRIINSAMNQEMFFGVANHKLTVVAVDASYTKPFATNVIMIAPGQTTDVLLTTDQTPATATAFTSQLRSPSKANVPLEIDESLFFTAYYQGQPGIFTTDFPPFPPVQFDYSGNVPRGYKYRHSEDHPMHLHGYNFYVVGSGFGNFNPKNDPAKFNLIDPPKRNTVGTPPGGWVAIRFEADNPDSAASTTGSAPMLNIKYYTLQFHPFTQYLDFFSSIL